MHREPNRRQDGNISALAYCEVSPRSQEVFFIIFFPSASTVSPPHLISDCPFPSTFHIDVGDQSWAQTPATFSHTFSRLAVPASHLPRSKDPAGNENCVGSILGASPACSPYPLQLHFPTKFFKGMAIDKWAHAALISRPHFAPSFRASQHDRKLRRRYTHQPLPFFTSSLLLHLKIVVHKIWSRLFLAAALALRCNCRQVLTGCHR